MAVVVTGAGGFVGSHVLAVLAAVDEEVVALRGRWGSLDDVRAAIGSRVVDRVIHLGWYTGPEYLNSESENRRGLRSGLELADFLVEMDPVPHLVVAGSSAERTYPTSRYGRAKAALRNRLFDEYPARGLSHVAWTQIFNVTGPGEDGSRFLSAVARAALEGRPFLMSDGAQIRDYIDVFDVAVALVELSAAGTAGIFDVATGKGRTLRDAAILTARAAGNPNILQIGAVPYRPGEVMMSIGDPTSLVEEVGWLPRYSLEDIAIRVAESWKHRSTRARL